MISRRFALACPALARSAGAVAAAAAAVVVPTACRQPATPAAIGSCTAPHAHTQLRHAVLWRRLSKHIQLKDTDTQSMGVVETESSAASKRRHTMQQQVADLLAEVEPVIAAIRLHGADHLSPQDEQRRLDAVKAVTAMLATVRKNLVSQAALSELINLLVGAIRDLRAPITHYTYNFQLLARQDQIRTFADAQAALLGMATANAHLGESLAIHPNKHTYRTILEALVTNGTFADGFRFAHEIPDGWDDYIYSTLMTLCMAHGQYQQALDIFDQLKKASLQPSSPCWGPISQHAYSIAIDAAIQLRRYSLVNELAAHAADNGVALNAYVHNSILRAVCETGDVVTATRMVDQSELVQASGSASGDALSTDTSSALADKAQQWAAILQGARSPPMIPLVKRAFEALAQMPEHYPITKTYLHMIKACFNCDRPDLAYAHYKQLLRKGIRPNLLIITATLHALVADSTRTLKPASYEASIDHILADVGRFGIKADDAIRIIQMQKAERRNQPLTVMSIFGRMNRPNLMAHCLMAGALIDSTRLTNAKNFRPPTPSQLSESVEKLLDDMYRRGLHPNDLFFARMLRYIRKIDNEPLLLRWLGLAQMAADTYQPGNFMAAQPSSRETLGAQLLAKAESEAAAAPQRGAHELPQSDATQRGETDMGGPTKMSLLSTYSHAMEFYASRGDPDRVRRLMDEMEAQRHGRPDMSHSTILMRAYVERSRRESMLPATETADAAKAANASSAAAAAVSRASTDAKILEIWNSWPLLDRAQRLYFTMTFFGWCLDSRDRDVLLQTEWRRLRAGDQTATTTTTTTPAPIADAAADPQQPEQPASRSGRPAVVHSVQDKIYARLVSALLGRGRTDEAVAVFVDDMVLDRVPAVEATCVALMQALKAHNDRAAGLRVWAVIQRDHPDVASGMLLRHPGLVPLDWQ
ncbi:hypothetical protein BC831DRAFT_451982 [Entophlyctis helioformis]|nr:hypothetical protein BC831DRAFT_451982 [Entophlyctis helioformis]